MLKAKFVSLMRKSVRSIWFFPVALAIPLFILTGLRINGSSIGVYTMLHGTSEKDVITKNYRGVRSDEWLVNTQMVAAQANNDFEVINDNIGYGQDMSLMDVPYKEWSVIFKPQNLIFFILPLDYAFAFKWWLVGYLLVVVTYLLSLEMFPGKKIRSAVIGIFVGLSPIIFWWYSTGVALCMTYCLVAALIAIRISKTRKTKHLLLLSLCLSYVLACFALILYPPFQIPCALAAGVFFISYLLENYKSKERKRLLISIGWTAGACVVAGLVLATFLLTRSKTINLVTNTVYPGTRVELSGGVNPLLSFSSFLSPNLQYDHKTAGGYLKNQSEASNFIFIAPYLLIPSLFLVYRQKKRHNKLLWGLLLMNLVMILLLARMYIPTPPFENFYRIFLFDKVPSTRLILGVGLVGLFQLLLLIKALEDTSVKRSEILTLALIGSISSLAVMLFVGIYTVEHFPLFIASYAKVVVFSLWITLGIFLIIMKRFTLGLAVLAGFSLLSVYRVNPLHRGLSSLVNSPIIETIKAYPDDGSWITLDDRFVINFPIVAGKDSLNTVQFYPQMEIWEQLDKPGRYEKIYNRYAHVVFSGDPELKELFTLKSGDLFYVRFDPCSDFIQSNAKYILSPDELHYQCVAFDKFIDQGQKDFYIYKIQPQSTP